MTYLTQEEKIDERVSSERATATGVVNEHTVVWKVVLSEETTNPQLYALRAPDVPRIGQAFTDVDYTSKCYSRVCENVGASKTVFEIRLEYTNDPDILESTEYPSDPLQMLPRKSWAYVRTQEVYTRSLDVSTKYPEGQPVANSVGVPYVPGLRRPYTYLVLRVVRNEQSFDPAIAASWFDKVNAGNWLGFTKGQVLFVGMSGDEKSDTTVPGQVYNEVTYELHMRKKPWEFDEVLDAGDSEWVDGIIGYTPTLPGVPPVPILGKVLRAIVRKVMDPLTEEEQYAPVTSDWPLDGNGRALKERVLDLDNSDVAVWNKFRKLEYADFNGLNLHQLFGSGPVLPPSWG